MKIQLLTLIPNTWSKEKIMSYFDVTDYQIKESRILKQNKGVKDAKSNRGRPISEEIKKKSS